MVVTYWPSTQLSIKRCTCLNNKCIRSRYRGITFTLWTWLNSVQTPTESRWPSKNYITRCHRQFEFVGVRGRQSSVRGSEFQSLLEIRCRSDSQLQTEGLGPQDPGWAAHQNEEEVLLLSEELGVNMLQSLFRLQLTSHTQPFRNPFATYSRMKVWEVYFSKEVCSFVIIVDYVSACTCIRIVVSRLYNMVDMP